MNPKADKIGRLADALKKCDAMKNPRTREQINNCLPEEISGRIDPSGAVGTVAWEMVHRCQDYHGGIERLMECVNVHERNSIPFEAARQVKEELFGAAGAPADLPEPEPPAQKKSAVKPGPPPPPDESVSAPQAESTPAESPSPNQKTEASKPEERKETSENTLPEKIVAFGFGIGFLLIMLYVARTDPTPSPFPAFVYRVMLALAAAGVGAVLPGMLNVEWKSPKIRAAGGFALFVIVYLLNPPAL